MVKLWEPCKVAYQENSVVEISVVLSRQILIMDSIGWPAWVSFEEDRLFKILRYNEVDWRGIYYVPVNQPLDVNCNKMDLFEVYTRMLEVKPAETYGYMPPDVLYVIGQIALIRLKRRVQRLENFTFGFTDLPLESLFEEKSRRHSRYPKVFKYFKRRWSKFLNKK
ncbi:uncharacterized LOC118063788 [Chelonus insularis]|uniref:uncharacterized LOC118063788 n=1 Tax=Chelonus insularis TaxID=460826 RepID=UPI001589C8B7|nr:uncharacterized LOC118063788 [Chelonus insularis]KAG8148360.1 CiV16.8g6-like protein [Chelonus insularis]